MFLSNNFCNIYSWLINYIQLIRVNQYTISIENYFKNNTKRSVENFNVIILIIIMDIEQKNLMTKIEKKQFKRNLIKFVIWIVLLLMSLSYIQKHPAEKVSVFSGFEVLFQKAEVFVQNIFGDHWDLLERKYSMEKYYKELIKMAENNKCMDLEKIKEMEDTYNNLKKEKIENLENILPEYTKKAYEYDNIVKENKC